MRISDWSSDGCSSDLELNHILHRLCGPPSIPLSFNLAAVLPRRRTYRVSYDTDLQSKPTSSSHRLRRGLPGYLILFAPHALVSQCQYRPRWLPSPFMFLPIYTPFTPTSEIPPPSTVRSEEHTPELQSLMTTSHVFFCL